MRNELRSASLQIRRTLRPAENDIQAAIESAARLTIAISEAQSLIKAPVAMGQDIYEEVANGLSHAIHMRGCIARAHASLAKLPAAVGHMHRLPETAWGDLQECPEEKASLTLVTAA